MEETSLAVESGATGQTQQKQADDICASCDSIISRSIGELEHSVSLGLFPSSQLKATCTCCGFFLELASSIGFSQKYQTFDFRMYYYPEKDPQKKEKDLGRFGVLFRSGSPEEYGEQSFLVRRNEIIQLSEKEQGGSMRAINLAEIQAWLSSCLVHDHSMVNSKNKFPILDVMNDAIELHLIDTKEECIVKHSLSAGREYAALSYVWGEAVQQVMLLKENYAKLTAKAALSKDVQSLPKTIRDAIDFCVLLGIRFLWVDALCIIQDDTDNKAQQIQNMGSIYRCAKLTIVGAAGNGANAGLPGVHVEPARKCPSLTLRGLHFYEWRATAIQHSKWNTRGWTLQEQVLSTRLIIVTENTVFCHCSKATFMDDFLSDGKLVKFGLNNMPPIRWDKPLPLIQDVADEAFPFKVYQRLVDSYIRRKLTNDVDMLNAFAGILQILEPSLGTAWGGIPKTQFTECLGWHEHTSLPLTRVAGFPSWSWAGWKGHTSAFSFMECHINPAFYRFGAASRRLDCFYDARIDTTTSDAHAATFSTGHPLPSDSDIFERFRSSNATSPSGSDLLLFWGWEVLLPVSRTPVQHAEYAVYDAAGKKVGQVTLDPTWRAQQHERLSFVIFAARLVTLDPPAGSDQGPTIKYMVQPIVVHRGAGGVAERVGWVSPWMDLERWFGFGPALRLLVLG